MGTTISKGIILIIVFLFSILIVSATRTDMSLEIRVKDSGGVSVADGRYDVDVYIYDDPSAGNLLYNLNTTVDTRDGLGYVTLNETQGIYTTKNLYIKIDFDENVYDTRLSMSTMPYAYRSNVTDDVECFECINESEISFDVYNTSEIDDNFSLYVPYAGATGDVNLGDNYLWSLDYIRMDELRISHSTQPVQYFTDENNINKGSFFYDIVGNYYALGKYNAGSWDGFVYKIFAGDGNHLVHYGNITSSGQICDSIGCIGDQSDLSNYVNKTDDESISGLKTFNNVTTFNDNATFSNGTSTLTIYYNGSNWRIG